MKKFIFKASIVGLFLLVSFISNTHALNKTYKDECKKYNFCQIKKLKRYIRYKDKHNISFKEAIIKVNINLDYDFYTNIKESPNLKRNIVLVNKYYYLDKNYVPENLEEVDTLYAKDNMYLVKEARDSFIDMANAAKEDGINIMVISSYRSYYYQKHLYNQYKKDDGQEKADKYSARPGFSEHQTGLSIDISDGKTDYNNFEQTESFNWMKKNSYKYGYILRYPKNKEKITGYQYESWHYRYVGKEIAKYIYEHGITFEEYYAEFLCNKKHPLY